MRMVLAHHVADDAGRLAVRLVRRVACLVHAVQDAPVHRLQPVAGVRQRARHDHAHGVIEVRAAHFHFQRDRLHVAVRADRLRRVVVYVAQINPACCLGLLGSIAD